MSRILNPQQIDQYQSDGFISPVDVLTEQQAAECLEMFESLERRYPDYANAENRNNLHMLCPFLDELVHHPVIVGAVQDLIGEDVAFWGSVMFIKEPETSAFVSWHQDATYMGMTRNDFVTPWIALTPSNRDNGCMTMIAGSHRDDIQQHEDTFAEDNILTRGQAIAVPDQSKAVDLELRPGQMSLHHAQTIHGSQPNVSRHRRVGFALQAYMPSDVRQTIGKNIWQPVSGRQATDNDLMPGRPSRLMDPEMVAQRQIANDNWATILYHGAKQRRAY